MLSFIVRRLVLMVPMLFVISVIAFVVIQLPPGDYLSTYITRLEAMGRKFDEAEIQNLKRMYGLDQPMYVQYLRWMRTVFQGTFGRSFVWEMTVADVLATRLPMTIIISLASLVVVWVLAIPIAIVSATQHNTFIDYFFTFIGFIGCGLEPYIAIVIPPDIQNITFETVIGIVPLIIIIHQLIIHTIFLYC